MTKLELIKANKKRYAEVEAEINSMSGIEKAVAETMTLAWIKGTKWMGGLSDSKAQKILESLEKQGWNVTDLCDEFDRQTEKYA